jgi:hypothetical protein
MAAPTRTLAVTTVIAGLVGILVGAIGMGAYDAVIRPTAPNVRQIAASTTPSPRPVSRTTTASKPTASRPIVLPSRSSSTFIMRGFLLVGQSHVQSYDNGGCSAQVHGHIIHGTGADIVLIYDNGGSKLLATASLDPGGLNRQDCEFAFAAEVPGGQGSYMVNAAATGQVRISEADARAGLADVDVGE